MTVNTQAPAWGRLVGSFRFATATQRWPWSEELGRMCVREPGSVVLPTKLVMSHKHPHDKAKVATFIDDAIQYGRPFSSRHRIIDAEGLVHVVVVGDLLYDEKDQLIGTTGFSSTSLTPTKATFKTLRDAGPMSSGCGAF